ncbi:Protein of unknown function [Lactobacillus delbrueckii subsp. lactis]|nr:Protein of unknown function [Lactobacillus delbrueckii subsp. lactis]CDR82737.1 Protein of unknown function [Lactobacillus delbrueckii subsp. lactis]
MQLTRAFAYAVSEYFV